MFMVVSLWLDRAGFRFVRTGGIAGSGAPHERMAVHSPSGSAASSITPD
jgi:hypothetical protein